ncbi:MAG: hypothetical protein NXH75_04925, partial [Halobacteriovoraceae bacterium]|nr:hypothetical protein [Halobacteriovoraceae bacterium]
EFRRGTSGGGNQLRQPFMRNYFGKEVFNDFPTTDHIHFFGYYIGNFPQLEKEKILNLCKILNSIK